MQPPPSGWPRLSASICYDDPARAIDWLCKAFGFEVRLRVDGENGRVEHAELAYGGGLIMTGSGKHGATHRRSPRALGGANTQCLAIFVDDVEAHHARARDAGAQIATPPTTNDYGPAYWTDRSYEAIDLEGHHWWFMQRLRTGSA